MYLEITVLWARIIEIKSLSLELTFLHFPPIEINFKNWAWISSNSRQLCLSMGRNYRCWIVGGLRARAPVKCLCFPPCLPSKDLHILTHYGVLWSWSAWLPQLAIMLIASGGKKKSSRVLKPRGLAAEGVKKKNVCLFLSVSPPFPHSLCFSAAAEEGGFRCCSFRIGGAMFAAKLKWESCAWIADFYFLSSPCLCLARCSPLTHAEILCDWLPFH